MTDEVAASAATEEKPAGAATEAALSTSGKDTKAGAGKGVQTEGGPGLGKEAAKADEPTGERSLWPDDWRERWAGKDEKELTRLRRFKEPDNVYRSLRSLENKVNSGFYRAALSDGASDEEVAEYRKAHGIPAEPNADGYGIKWPDGYEATESDKADLAAFLGEMHGGHVPAATVQKVWQSYVAMQAKAAEELQVAAALKADENKAEVRGKYMNEKGRFDRVRFERDVRLGNAFLAEHLGDERSQQITALTLADGTKLGDHPLFFELFTAAALKGADDDALFVNETPGGGAGNLEEQYQAALALADTDPKAYHSAEHQAKLTRLVNARIARGNKKAA